MSVLTKIILDTAEYNRLLSIEKAYQELKAQKQAEEHQQLGKGNSEKCTCKSKTTSCSCTPPLSQIIADNDKAKAVDIPTRGVLPSITDPNEHGYGSTSSSTSQVVNSENEKAKEFFDSSNFRSLANETDKWYFLGHFEEK